MLVSSGDIGLTRLALDDHVEHLVRRSDPGHSWEDCVHESLHGIFVRVAAGIAHDDQVVIQIACRIDGRGDADIDGTPGNDDRVDALIAQRQVEIRLMKRAPAVFRDYEVLRLWLYF